MSWWIAQQIGTVLVAAILVHAATRVWRLAPVVRHALWAVLLIKLVMPPVIAWPWRMAQTPAASTSVLHDRSDTTNRPRSSGALDRARLVAPGAVDRSATSAASSSPVSWSWSNVSYVVWLAGSIGFAAVQLVRGVRMARLLRRGTAPPPWLRASVDGVARRFGMRAPVVRLAAVSSPMIWSGVRVTLVWPSQLSDSAAAASALITHELAHVARRDHWLGWIEAIGGCLWWWNPLFWHVRAEMRANAELACDAWATHLSPGARRSYAEALIAVCEGARATPDVPVSIVGIRAANRRALERRLTMIMQAGSPVRVSRTAAVAIAIVAALSLPAWAQRSTTSSGSATAAKTPAPPSQPAASTSTSAPSPRSVVQPSTSRGSVQTIVVPDMTPSALAPVTMETESVALPANAQAALDQYETQRLLLQEHLIFQLQAIQDTETKAGHLDEALAVRARIRALQANPTDASTTILRTITRQPEGATFTRDGVEVQPATPDTPPVIEYQSGDGVPPPPPPPAPTPAAR